MADSYTLVLSGPLSTKRPFEVSLAKAGIARTTPLGNGWHHFPPTMPCPGCWRDADPECGCGGTRLVPEPTVNNPDVGWVRCVADHPDAVGPLAARYGWQLRTHHHTPAPPETSSAQLIRAELDDIKAQLAELRGA
jgi:hypothetical protein